jgi:ubiquinone/menaquinone biosynthesis C-methylase UbiE
MGWDSKWEEFYKKSGGNEYPETAVVRFIARNFYKSNNRNKIKILDLGCGTGANLWYLSREGFSASGIDGSKTAIERTGEKLDREGINANLLTGDFQNLPYAPNFFDAVLDITSIQHNDDASIRKIVAEVHRVMKPDGKYFGMMINSDENLTARDFFTNYSDENDVQGLFSNFNSVELNHSYYTEDRARKRIKFIQIDATK